jgi:hypothetical protein
LKDYLLRKQPLLRLYEIDCPALATTIKVRLHKEVTTTQLLSEFGST